jgi:hypothetical protein
MSVRKIIELERMLYNQGIMVSLTVTPNGLIIEGPNYADLILAKSELRKMEVIIAGHVQRRFDDWANTNLSAI